MRSFLKLSTLTAVLLLIAASLVGQGTTGSIAGNVTQDGNALPGVTVTATSPNLQGERQTVTNESGGYQIGNLPPGPYTVTFELSGLQTATRQQHVGVAQSVNINADMKVSAVTEAITVTAAAPAVAETKEVQANYSHELIQELPMGRRVQDITALSPGVVVGVNGPSISGGFSFDNLYTVNGAVIQENLRGQPHNLFIEDAIQETTVQVAGVSAEFGNFTGGVVNAITKSGGNEFSGSLRDSLINPEWSSRSRDIFALNTATPDPNDIERRPQPKNTGDINQTYEATFGGRIIRDRLWFFAAGRDAEVSAPRVFTDSLGSNRYTFESTERRLEGKLTASITQRHTLVGSYLEAPISNTNECQVTNCYDEQGLIASSGRDANFMTLNYNGVLTNNFLIEGRWSAKEFTFIDVGGTDHDRVTGTPLLVGKSGGYTNESYFCGNCTPEERDNDAYAAKLTYYLGTKSLGTHNLTGGYDHWHEKRLANNYQSPTDFTFQANQFPAKKVNGQTLVSIAGGTSLTDIIINWPILIGSLGSDLNTDSMWVNDRWDINNRWTVNLGARFDKNDSKNSVGASVADDSLISPRIGASFDMFGNGRLRWNASYGVYAGRLAETITSLNSPAGTPAIIVAYYEGPNIVDQTPEEAMRQVWSWVDSQGGFDALTKIQQTIPGVSTQIRESLVSPNVKEIAFGVGTQLGSAFLRADYVRRDWDDFYASARDLAIGRVTLPSGAPSDLTLVQNSDVLNREYQGITLQGAYRLMNRISLGGNYTWSELTGNVSQESVGSVVVTASSSATNFQPEYFGFDQNNPDGFLPGDSTHKIRAWAAVDFPTFLGNFNVSVLQNFDTGQTYSDSALIDIRSNANFYCPQTLAGTVTACGQAGGVVNPGYVTPPATVNYFFSDRGEFRFDDITATSLALNYDTNPSWLRGVALFAEVEVLNLFDESAAQWNTTILTHRDAGCFQTAAPTQRCARFNPIAGDQPVEGVHYRKDPRYGKPTGATVPIVGVDGLSFGGNFQTPRTYRASLGFRF